MNLARHKEKSQKLAIINHNLKVYVNIQVKNRKMKFLNSRFYACLDPNLGRNEKKQQHGKRAKNRQKKITT